MWEDVQMHLTTVQPGEQLDSVNHILDTCQPHAVDRVQDLFHRTSKKSQNK